MTESRVTETFEHKVISAVPRQLIARIKIIATIDGDPQGPWVMEDRFTATQSFYDTEQLGTDLKEDLGDQFFWVVEDEHGRVVHIYPHQLDAVIDLLQQCKAEGGEQTKESLTESTTTS